MASNPSSAAVSSRKRPTAPSIVSTQSAQSALTAAPSDYSYSSSSSSSSGSVDPGKKSTIILHDNSFISQQGGAQMVDITGTLDGSQQHAAALQAQQLLMLSAIVQQHQQQQQQPQQHPQQYIFALLNSFAAGNGLNGVASPFVGTSPGVPPPHPPPYNQSVTPPMLQKSSTDKCSGAIGGGGVTVPMANNANNSPNVANANQQNILRSCALPAMTTTPLGNNITGQNTTGQLLASFGIPLYEPYELYQRLQSALQQHSSPAAMPQSWLAASQLAPQLQPNSANGIKQSPPQSNQQLCHASPPSAAISRQTESKVSSNGIDSANNESSAFEKVPNSSKRRSTCPSQCSAFTPLANSPTEKTAMNGISLRGNVPKMQQNTGEREDGKKRGGEGAAEAKQMREVTSGARRAVPRKTRRLSVESSVGRTDANSTSPNNESPEMAVASARSNTASQQSFGSVNDLMPATYDSCSAQNMSPSSSQSSESPAETNASPMEQDGEVPIADSFQCLWQKCGEMFTKEKPFVDHVNEHVRAEQSPSFFCRWSTCKRREPFNAQYMLAQHVRKHSGEKPYQCEYVFPDGTRCKKSYSRLENKKTHERTHNGERPYQCAVCKKSFTNASDKAKHQNRTHKKTKDYHCPVMGCTKQYTDPSSLRKHVFNEHGEEVWHFAKQSKEEKGSKTYGINLIGIRENGTPYFIPQAQVSASSSDEDHEVDVMSTTPPPGGQMPRTFRAGSHGEDRHQQQQRTTAQWPEMDTGGQQTGTGPTEQPQQQHGRQPKQESVTSPAGQNISNGAVAEQHTSLSNSTTRLQQLKMDRGTAEYQSHSRQQQQMLGFTQHHQQQQQQANVPQHPPMVQPPQHRPPASHPMLSHKLEFPSPTHASPASVVHVVSHHQPQFFGPSHNNSPNANPMNNGTTPPAIFDFQTQQFREFDFMNSPEDPMPSSESGGYGGDGTAYGRVPMGGYHHHHQLHAHLHGDGHIAYAEGDGCAVNEVTAVQHHQRHYAYQQQCPCKECFAACRPPPPPVTHPPYPPPPLPSSATAVDQANAQYYAMCTYDNSRKGMASGCCQRAEAVQQNQQQQQQQQRQQQHLYEAPMAVQQTQQQHFREEQHGQHQHVLVQHHPQQHQQPPHYHPQLHQQMQAVHHGEMEIGHVNGGAMHQILHHGHPNENEAQRVGPPSGGHLSAGMLEDIELDEVSSTFSDLKMSGGREGDGAGGGTSR
ncbi:hypothetical protein niasHS_000589 [Heterodera schachtii]|uniref:C2H2-type domain-containing protein n=1 Tax=Heterodera schachtii TaxID=97005 RepID=A0ABD2K5F7_HETSC